MLFFCLSKNKESRGHCIYKGNLQHSNTQEVIASELFKNRKKISLIKTHKPIQRKIRIKNNKIKDVNHSINSRDNWGKILLKTKGKRQNSNLSLSFLSKATIMPKSLRRLHNTIIITMRCSSRIEARRGRQRSFTIISLRKTRRERFLSLKEMKQV